MDPSSVGIDVAKAHLDVAVRPSGQQWGVPNAETGSSDLVGRLQALPLTLVVLEVAGGREVPVAAALATAGLPVAVVTPRQVRDFARASGQLAKTDALDAQGDRPVSPRSSAPPRARSPTRPPRNSPPCWPVVGNSSGC